MSSPLCDRLYINKTAKEEDFLPPKSSKKTKPTDWVMITAIAIAAIGALVVAFSYFCISGVFPIEIFGGMDKTLFIAAGALLAAASAGGVIYYKREVARIEN
jgi:hypothetical protein